MTKMHELPDVFRGSEARRAGLITKAQLRGPSVRRLFQDVYAPANIEVTHELRCRGAALLVPPQAVLTGRSAASVLGVDLAKPYDPVEFIVPEEFRFGPIVGILVRRTNVKKKFSRPWNSCRIARPARIALDLLLRLSPRTRGHIRKLRIGVPDLDAFLRAKWIQRKKLVSLFVRSRHRGIRFAREALRLADPLAESPRESELRVVLTTQGFSLISQLVVRKNGRFLGRLDLALKAAKIAIEYDGRQWHESPAQQAKDLARRSRLIAEGWRFVIVTAEQLAEDYQGIIKRIQELQADS